MCVWGGGEMCARLCACTQAISTHVVARGHSLSSFLVLHLIFLKQGFSMNLELINRLDSLAGVFPSFCPCLPVPRLQVCVHHSWLFKSVVRIQTQFLILEQPSLSSLSVLPASHCGLDLYSLVISDVNHFSFGCLVHFQIIFLFIFSWIFEPFIYPSYSPNATRITHSPTVWLLTSLSIASFCAEACWSGAVLSVQFCFHFLYTGISSKDLSRIPASWRVCPVSV